MLPAGTDTFPALLTEGAFDMALSIAADTPGWIARKRAFGASNAVAARRGHPRLGGLAWGDRLPLELFCELPHAIFSVNRDFAHVEDAELSRLGRRRPVAVTVPGYFGLGRLVAQSDLLGVLPTRFALSVAGSLGLDVYRLPFEQPLVELFLFWRERDTQSPEQIWLRNLVLAALSPLDEARYPVSAEEFRAS